MSKKNSRTEWHEPMEAIGDELDNPIEDTIEVGTVALIDGPLDPVPLTASGRDSSDDSQPSVSNTVQTMTQNIQDSVSDIAAQAQNLGKTAVEKTQDAAQKITAQATEKVADAKTTAGGTGKAAQEAFSSVAGKISSAGATGVQSTGTALWTLVQRSPLQALVFFASLAWLIRHHKAAASQPPVSFSDAASDAAVKAGSLAGQVQATAGTLGAQVQEQAQRGSGWFSQTLQENPLAIGAMAIVFGAGLGFAVPESAYENRLLGKTRDSLADKAQEAAQDFSQKVQTVAQTAVQGAIETVKEEAKNQGLTG